MSSTRKEEEKKQESKYRPKTKNALSKNKYKKNLDKNKKQNNFIGIDSFVNVSNNPPPELMNSSSSLIKYETPFLVSATVSNKKLLAELDQDTEKTNSILRSIFYRNKT